MIEFTPGELKIIERALVCQFYELESAYKRNVNFNKTYADAIVERCSAVCDVYGRITGHREIFCDSDSLRQRLFGQCKLDLV